MPEPDAQRAHTDDVDTSRPDAAVAAASDDRPRSPDAARLLALTAGVLANIQSVVGEGAARALFRYGASEEGKRIAREAGQGRLDIALQALDDILGQSSTGTRNQDGSVEIHIRHCTLFDEGQTALDLLLVGLYEGVLHAVLETRYEGHILGRRANGQVLLRFEDAASDR